MTDELATATQLVDIDDVLDAVLAVSRPPAPTAVRVGRKLRAARDRAP